ncbi:MAG: PAS domain S-box protein, partial [Anaerolineales bacterium]|nr:PAS domain S-box protein [Anaerolineales bacterium]
MNNKSATGKRAHPRSAQSKTGSDQVNLNAGKLSVSGSSDLFRDLVENLNEVVFTVDLEGRFVYMSPVIEKFSGYKPEEVIGSSFSQFIHPDDLPEAMKAFATALGGADYMSAEFRVYNKRGEIWYANVSTHIMLTNKKISGLTGVMTDITERKHAEQALRASEQEKLAILNAIPDIMFHLDRNGVFLDYKAENQQKLLLAPSDFLGKSVQEVLPEWLSDLTLQNLNAALTEKKIQIYDYRLEIAGSEHYFEARMMPFQEDHVLIIIRDMTEQKQAEHAIQETEQKYRALVEQIPAIVYTDSAEEVGRTHYISPQIKTLLGFDPEAWSENNDLWTKAIHPDDRERVLADYNRTYKSGDPFLAEYRVHTKSGKIVWIRDESVLIRDPNGSPSIWQGIMLDITERKQAEAALVESEERYRKMVELSPEAILVHTGGKIVYINQAGLRLIGITNVDEIVGKPVMDLIHPDTREVATRRINETLKSKNPSKPIKEKLTRADGFIAEVEISNMPLVYAGKPAIQIMIRDITSQHQAEEERRLNEQRLETLIRLAQMNTASLDELTDFAMEQAVQLTGSTIGYIAFLSDDEEILTMHSWSKAAMQECKIIDKPINYPVKDTGLWGEAVRQRKPIITNDYQGPNPGKKGTPGGHVSLTRHMNVPIFDGEHIVIVAGVGNKATHYNEMDVQQLTLLMDGVWQIIRRNQADDALRESENKFRNVIEQATEGIVLVDEKGMVIEFNQAIAEISGIDRNNVLGIPFWELQ